MGFRLKMSVFEAKIMPEFWVVLMLGKDVGKWFWSMKLVRGRYFCLQFQGHVSILGAQILRDFKIKFEGLKTCVLRGFEAKITFQILAHFECLEK